MKTRGRGKGQPRQVWQEIVLSYWCPECQSGPGRWCITKTGTDKPEPHAARVEVIARCPRCRAWLNAEWPETLCPRCEQRANAMRTMKAIRELDPDPRDG